MNDSKYVFTKVLFLSVLSVVLAAPAWALQQTPLPDTQTIAVGPIALQETEEEKEAKKSQQQANAKSSKEPGAEVARTKRRPRRESATARVSRSSRELLSLFGPIVKKTMRSTVQIRSGKDPVAMGLIVDSNGFVLTKHSELKTPIICELSDGKSVAAQVFGVHKATDLALLQLLDTSRLPAVRWAKGPAPQIGAWLASASNEENPLGIGIVSVNARRIVPARGFMGVTLGTDSKGTVFIDQVTPRSPADRAGVRVADVVVQVDNKPVKSIVQLKEIVTGHPPGDEIEMLVLRGDDKLTLEITLGREQDLNPFFERSNQQNSMGSALSDRRHDFPLAIQHDTNLDDIECGGPVVDIDGHVVGVNIARQGRVSSLMLPTSIVRDVIEELKTGQFAPALVNKQRIDEINRLLEETRNTLNISPIDRKELTAKLKELSVAEKKASENLDKALADLRKATKDKLKVEIKLGETKDRQVEAQKRRQSLRQELQKLVTGTK